MAGRYRIITTTYGTDGDDSLAAWPGHDTIYGGLGNDWLAGHDGSDRLVGGDGNDILLGGPGYDTLDGGAGDDLLFGGEGGDIMDGGPGQDTVSYATAEVGVEIALLPGSPTGDGFDHLWNIENVVGSSYGDVITGDANINRLDGGSGGDTLDGGAGRDTVIYWQAPNGVSVDLALGSAQGYGNDRLVGIESVIGSRFADVLVGDAQENWLTGRAGDDRLDGGEGFDVASFAYADQAVTVRLDDPATPGLGSAAGEGNDTLIGIEGAVGSRFDDSLFGCSSAERLYGGVGADSLNGLSGDDLLYGGAGNDIFVFGPASGRDQIRDFQPDYDVIDLRGVAIGDVLPRIEAASSGSLIHLSADDMLLIVAVQPSELVASDFLLTA